MSRLEELDAILERLIKECGPATLYSVYLRDITDHKNRWETYRDSYAGNIIEMNIINAENALILYCSRIWETNQDGRSIPNAQNLISSNRDDIVERRSKDIEAQHVKKWKAKQHRFIEDSFDRYHELANSQTLRVSRNIRTENLAHLLENSRDKNRNFPEGFENHGVTLNDLCDYADRSTKLIQDFYRFVTGTDHSLEENAEVFKYYCESFWNIMPVFRNAEQSKL